MTSETSGISQDSKNMALILWVGSIFFGFIPGLIFYLAQKEDQYIQDQAKESLNWSITAIIAYIIALVLTVAVIGIFLIPVIAITHIVFCIMGAVATSKGQVFRVPLAIRLLK